MTTDAMKHLFTWLLCSAAFVGARAQTEPTYYPEPTEDSVQTAPAPAPRLRFGAEVGASVATFGDLGMAGSYLSPRLSYALSPRWQVAVGGSYAQFNTFGSGFEGVPVGPFRAAGGYVAVTYQANERLSISGLMMHQTLLDDPQTGNFQRDLYLAEMSAEYRITPNLSVGMGVRSTRGPLFINAFPGGGTGVGRPLQRYPLNGAW